MDLDNTSFPVSARQSPPRLLTVTEACAELRVSRWLFYELVRSQQLRTIKIGRRRLVSAAHLRELLEQLAEHQRSEP